MKYTEKFNLVSKWLTSFPGEKLKLMKLKSSEQMIAVEALHKFITNNIKIGIREFEAEDFADIIDVSAKNISVRQNDDKQYFQ